MHKEEKGSLQQPAAGPSRHPFLLLLIKSVSQVEATIEEKQQRHNAEAPFNVNYFIVKSPLLSTGGKREKGKSSNCDAASVRKERKRKNCHCVISIDRGTISWGEGGVSCARRWLITSPSLRTDHRRASPPKDKTLVSPSTQSGRAKYPAWAG